MTLDQAVKNVEAMQDIVARLRSSLDGIDMLLVAPADPAALPKQAAAIRADLVVLAGLESHLLGIIEGTPPEGTVPAQPPETTIPKPSLN